MIGSIRIGFLILSFQFSFFLNSVESDHHDLTWEDLHYLKQMNNYETNLQEGKKRKLKKVCRQWPVNALCSLGHLIEIFN